jgi:hypothetical protein
MLHSVTEPGHYQVTVQNECGVDDGDLYVEAIQDPIVDFDLTRYCVVHSYLLLDVANSVELNTCGRMDRG